MRASARGLASLFVCSFAIAQARCATPLAPTPQDPGAAVARWSGLTPPRDTLVSLSARHWTKISDPRDIPLSNDGEGALVFNFARGPQSMGYLYRSSPSARIAGAFVVSVTIAGDAPMFSFATEASNTCPGAAEMRLWFLAHDDWDGEFGRWWSHTLTVPLALGSTTLTVPIDAGEWSSVDGKLGNDPLAADGWRSAIRDVSAIGMTFGGGCFFGHGVFLDSGTAHFALTHYEIRP